MSDFETVREFLGYIDYREHQNGNPWEALRMIEDRLRDAEERAAVKEPFDYIESLESRLSAAEEEHEGHLRKARVMIANVEAKLQRAEEVVEAVKEYADRLGFFDLQGIIRRYEEEKK